MNLTFCPTVFCITASSPDPVSSIKIVKSFAEPSVIPGSANLTTLENTGDDPPPD